MPELRFDEIYISIERYCELKNICRAKFYQDKRNGKIPFPIVKRKGYGKKSFLIIKKKDLIYIDKDNNVIMPRDL